jgi:hypothetical protein
MDIKGAGCRIVNYIEATSKHCNKTSVWIDAGSFRTANLLSASQKGFSSLELLFVCRGSRNVGL